LIVFVFLFYRTVFLAALSLSCLLAFDAFAFSRFFSVSCAFFVFFFDAFVFSFSSFALFVFVVVFGFF